MEQEELGAYFGIILLAVFLLMAVLFFLTQHQILELISRDHRHMPPGQVWLQLIPIFGLVWQFIVIGRLSDSIHSQLTTPTGDALFAEDESIPPRPTYRLGISYAILVCITMIPVPLIQGIASLVTLGVWIVYWVTLWRYKKKIKARLLTASKPI